MSSTIPTAADRQNEVAALVLSAERVANRMIERAPAHGGPPTLTVSADEWATTTMHMCRLAGCARELHGILASGVPSRDELIHLNGHLTTAATALTDAIRLMQGVTARMLMEPKADAEGVIDG